MIHNLQARTSAAPGVGQSATIVVRKNGSDTAIQVIMGATDTTGSDITDAVTFAQGDDLSVKVVTSAGATIADLIVTLEQY